MPAKSTEPLTRHLVRLYEGDFARLRELHPGLDSTTVIRTLVRRHIEAAERAAKTELPDD